ncbi:hypothetical protein [Prosthecobacter sp.]|jgi:hypothetical protein|uniref:hypothetical protein n=1 Tax=Prosthecobacter sp. TaxID=1965333 RepID=UPI002ABA9DB0|nr:hypothetical protein [Prosthecobacter sp.]MDZ4402163.1 hypothetical protein [Prosthecobacter sp.]
MAAPSPKSMLLSSPAIADRIASRHGAKASVVTVSKMVGTKEVSEFMRLVSAAQKSTRKMGMKVR